ncbi:MAG: hypothetical protein ACXWLA_12350 [Myxococcaceae bacterium]
MAKPTPVRDLAATTPMAQAARAFLAARRADVQQQLGKLGPRSRCSATASASGVRIGSSASSRTPWGRSVTCTSSWTASG